MTAQRRAAWEVREAIRAVGELPSPTLEESRVKLAVASALLWTLSNPGATDADTYVGRALAARRGKK